ncbi:SDR family NAD(P)-dependent oxidoreductase [Solimonas sp. K1W22B-7]|uniref:SDR family NAD(P)-dependent oxidoreductase n=1 Tax=Solimonas sp. K1W22B-7 TaxID=2303331 RepID=UPI000E3359F0|nr:SDR family NAD(P)-dependent oxidoreductase [Solimonas sp. K1W22B-7]AXQ27945.1 SDR family NAD(P)-dependent oxidoreductase [Solimonas sp. K1W22B-7]
MKTLAGKVAVITGAGSGFGRELALLCAQEGMRLSLADVDEKGLQATRDLLPAGTAALLQRCDVSQSWQVQQLAERTYAEYGSVQLLFNNAGVAVAGPTWTTTEQDWEWVLGVNLMGVVHGIRNFVPRMLKQGDECHIVNTASVAGLLAVPASSVYCVSKHGVVVMSECLHHELEAAKASIGVSVLCPAYVNTGIADAARNRPGELAAANPEAAAYEERVRQAVKKGKISAADVARVTIDAVKENRFYILTHANIKPAVEMRLRDIIDGGQPRNPMP